MAVTEPRTAKGRATRERILESATQLMVDHGVGATSLDDVIAQAGVSKSQLYHYFEDKDDLVDAVVCRTVDVVLDSQPHLADLSSWSAIRAWFDDLVGYQVKRHGIGGCPMGGLASELAEQRESARRDLAEGYARWEAPLRDGLADLRRRGRLKSSADPAAMATATLAAIQGGLLLTQTRRDPEQLRIALDAMYRYLRTYAA